MRVEEETPHLRCYSPGSREEINSSPLCISGHGNDTSPILRGLSGTGNVFPWRPETESLVAVGAEASRRFGRARITRWRKKKATGIILLFEREKST